MRQANRIFDSKNHENEITKLDLVTLDVCDFLQSRLFKK
jgi:hypothetical protein